MKRGEKIKWLTNKDAMMQGAAKWLHQDVDYVRNGQIVLDKLYDAVDRKLPKADRVLRSFKAQAMGPFFKEAISNPNLPVTDLIRKLHSAELDLLQILQKFPGAEVHHFNAVSGTDIYPREWSFKDILQVGAHIEALGGSTGLTSHGTTPLTTQAHRGASPNEVVAHTNLPRIVDDVYRDLSVDTGAYTGKQDLGIETTGGLMLPIETQGGKIYWSSELIDPATGQFKPRITPQAAAEALTPTSIQPQKWAAMIAKNNPVEALSRRVLMQALPEGMDPNDLTQWQFANKMLKGLGLDINEIRRNLTHNLGGSLRIGKGLKLPNLDAIRDFAHEAIVKQKFAVSSLPNVTELNQLGRAITQGRVSGDLKFGINPLAIGAGIKSLTDVGGVAADLIPSGKRAEELETARLNNGEGIGEALTNYSVESAANVATGLAMSKLTGAGLSKAKFLRNPYVAAGALTIGAPVIAKQLVEAGDGITRAHYPSHTDDPKDSYGLYGNTRTATLKVLEDQREFAQQMEPRTSQTAATKLGNAVEQWATKPGNEIKYLYNQSIDWLKNLGNID